jgi:hypothetical protein
MQRRPQNHVTCPVQATSCNKLGSPGEPVYLGLPRMRATTETCQHPDFPGGG